MTPVQKLLSDSLKALENYGWIKGSWGSEEDGFCSYGAVIYATGNRFDHSVAQEVSRSRGLLQELAGVDNIAEWNDSEARTASEVWDLFERAIAEAQRRGV